jgi:hypothetical protein
MMSLNKIPVVKTPSNQRLLVKIYQAIQDSTHSRKASLSETIILDKVPFPKRLPSTSFDSLILEHIQTHTKHVALQTMRLSSAPTKQVRVFYMLEKRINLTNRSQLIETLFSTLQPFLGEPSSFPDVLDIYLYLTSLKKLCPKNKGKPLGYFELNTGMTYVNHNEIVVFREEEWFKVLIHESFHALGIDFSGVGDNNTQIKQMFPLSKKLDVLLSESYAEFWAVFLNTCFISYFCSQTFAHFVSSVQSLMITEKRMKVYQLVKVLALQNLRYEDIYKDDNKKFHEETNVFAYCIIGCILIFFHNSFLQFCSDENTKSLIFSPKSTQYVNKMCNFIRTVYQHRGFVEAINFVEEHKIKSLEKTLRMSCFELEI